MLVFSEIAYPAWKAYLDGKPTTLFIANHALRAVHLPPGDHVVDLKFESDALRLGLAVSLAAYTGFGCLAIAVTIARASPSDRRQAVRAAPRPGQTPATTRTVASEGSAQ